MARPIATINGREIFSDKTVRTITNTRIDFSDGSWCDGRTGEVVNKGAGYITLGTPPSDEMSNTTTRGPQTYNSRSLEVRGVNADVDIEVHSNNNIEVTITGPENLIKGIKVFENGGCLYIEDENQGKGKDSFISKFGNFFSSGNINTTIISGSGIVINQRGNGGSETKISVKVPVGTPVSVSEIIGMTTIGDTEASINVHVISGDVNAGRVSDANLKIQGGGDISIEYLSGFLNAQVMGSGDILVKAGKVSMLSASVMGSGDIDINHVVNRPVQNVMGTGDINISKIGN